MNQWSLALYGPSGLLGALESGETQFVLGAEAAADLLNIQGEGVAARHASVWITEGRMQVEDLGGGTLVVEQKHADPSHAATLVQSPRQGRAESGEW